MIKTRYYNEANTDEFKAAVAQRLASGPDSISSLKEYLVFNGWKGLGNLADFEYRLEQAGFKVEHIYKKGSGNIVQRRNVMLKNDGQVLLDHINKLNAGEYADEPICDDIKTWHDLGVFTPDELDEWVAPMP